MDEDKKLEIFQIIMFFVWVAIILGGFGVQAYLGIIPPL